MIKRLALGFFLITVYLAFSQTKDSQRHEIVIGTDNDFFVPIASSDRNYTYGLQATYRWIPKQKSTFLSGIFPSNQGYAHGIRFKLEAYTPNYRDNDVSQPSVSLRPFAGWSYFQFNSHYIFEKTYLQIGLDAGILGEDSQAGALQNWFHDHVTKDPSVDWSTQLPNQLGINIRVTYGYQLLRRKQWDTYLTIDSSIGSIFTYLWPSVVWRIGKSAAITRSIGTNNALFNITSQAEWFFDVGFGNKISIYNATLTGNISDLNLSSIFEQTNNFVWNGQLGVHYSLPKFAASFRYYYSTGEFDKTATHGYGSLDFYYRF